jgi:PTH1 family peptidyl-tRNA hydrolase
LRGLRWRKRFLKPYYYAREREPNAAGKTLFLVKPLTYMNRSGEVLPDVLKKSGLDIDSLLVICDNLDLTPGRLRLKRNSGTAGHKGIRSIRDMVDSIAFEKPFLTLFVGIGRSEKEGVVDYVLGRPDEAEKEKYRNAIETGAKGVLKLLDSAPQQVMNELNRK